ncbi:phosphotransferase [Paremcibacter congregatus]|uniref:phosphotransferase n=1 Tax=Paremcibacter congregatus TaxID=2043170 RepID=UPI0030ED1724
MTEDRFAQSHRFLATAGWDAAQRTPLADDASFRRYERLTLGEQSAILMDAPPAFENVRPFVAVARYLKSRGLAAPEILADDLIQGFLLLEDLGDGVFSRLIDHDDAEEAPLYEMAIDGLIALQTETPPEALSVATGVMHCLPRYDQDLLTREVGLFCDWYLPALGGKPLSDEVRADFMAQWRAPLHRAAQDLDCLTLRDYHADNLMLRTGQGDLDRLGLLDFQDAVIGHKAYDLVSILQDARRDVPPALEAAMLERYLDAGHMEEATFREAYAILGAQRNAKIIGIFARLYLRDGKATYLKLIPRVWELLERDLAHPALSSVKDWIDAHIAPGQRRTPCAPEEFLPRKAMILSAGLGARMRPLTQTCPKPLVTVANKPLLGYSLEGLVAAGVRDVVLNCHYLADQIEEYATDYYDHRLTLTLSDERAELMDSGGGVKQALPLLGRQPFYVLNSDMIWRDGPERQAMLHRLQAFWHAEDMDILLLLVEKDRAYGYDGAGDYHLGPRGRLTHRGNDVTADHVYGGVLIMKPDCFADTPDTPFSLRLLFDRAAAAGRLYGVVHEGDWYHVGTAAAKREMDEILGD